MIKISCAIDQIKSLTSDEVKAILDKDKKGEFLLLDVRQPEEYEAGHIPGAVLIPLGELESRQVELDQKRKIITYCRSGHRSMAAAIALCGFGFKNIHHIEGGILKWQHDIIVGLPEEKPELIIEIADIKDTLILAIILEKGSEDFYLTARGKVQSLQVKDSFERLAKAEYKHIQRLYERGINLLTGLVLPPLEQLRSELKVQYIEGGIEINPALARIESGIDSEMDALEIALEKEYMSYDFYKRASALVKDSDIKVLLHELAWEERSHADILLKRIAEVV